MKRIPLITSFVLFILLCVTGSYWVMRLIKPEARKFSVPQVNKPVANVESVASLFGGAMLVDTNYQLKGVVQANPMNQSVAIIAVDGAAKAYPMNTELNPGSALNEVYSNYVLLQDNGVSKRVELPQDTSMSQITEVISPVANHKLPRSQSKAANSKDSSTAGHGKTLMGEDQGMKLPPEPPPVNPRR